MWPTNCFVLDHKSEWEFTPESGYSYLIPFNISYGLISGTFGQF